MDDFSRLQGCVCVCVSVVEGGVGFLLMELLSVDAKIELLRVSGFQSSRERSKLEHVCGFPVITRRLAKHR